MQIEIAKITKPLASVYATAQKGNEATFHDTGDCINNKATGKLTQLRLDGKLDYLDLWIEVPERLVQTSPCVRPTQQK